MEQDDSKSKESEATGFLIGNFNVKNKVEEKRVDQNLSAASQLREEVKKKALGSLGGSMVYVERTPMMWQGDDEK